MKFRMRMLTTWFAFVLLFSFLSPVSLASGDFEPPDDDAGMLSTIQNAEPAPAILPLSAPSPESEGGDEERGSPELATPALAESGRPMGQHVTMSFGLTAGVLSNGNAPSFTPQAKVVLTGRDLIAGEFAFSFIGSNTPEQIATNDADGNIVFDPVYLRAEDEGTLLYYLIEAVVPTPRDPSIDYDRRAIDIEVRFTSTSETTFDVSVQYLELTTLHHHYHPTGEWTPTFYKELLGRELVEHEFEFMLQDVNGNIVSFAKNDGAGVITFQPIVYRDTASGKTFQYTVQEKKPDVPETGMTYDLTPKTVVVSVTSDASGQLSVLPAYPDDTTLHNAYEASGSWTPQVRKVLIGSTLQAGDHRFELRQGDLLIEAVTNAAAGQVVFSPLAYTESDIGKTYTYTIREIKPATPLPDIIYDPMVITISVAITDAGHGVLNVTPTYSEATTFTNVYPASGTWLPTGTTYLHGGGRALKEDEFSFTLSQLNESSGLYEAIGTYGHAVDGTIRFETLDYSVWDVGKTFFYRIAEITGAELGMSYAEDTWYVEVDVRQNVPGQLIVTPTYTTYVEVQDGVWRWVTHSTALFENLYKAHGAWTPRAAKSLRGRPLQAGDFSFDLFVNGDHYETVANAADGSITFGTLLFDQTLIGRSYVYTIKEVVPAIPEPDMIYDPVEITILLSVLDAGNGQLNLEVTYPEDLTFDNEFPASGEWLPVGRKILDAGGRTLKEDEFEFELKLFNGEKGDYDLIDVYGHDTTGSIKFSPIPYTQKDDGKTYNYVIREFLRDQPNMTLDLTVFYVTVEINSVDDTGRLDVKPTYYYVAYDEQGDGYMAYVDEATFTNMYRASTTWAPEVSKVLTGHTLADHEFSFELRENGHVLQTVSHTADGQIPFEPLTFSEADINETYVYTIQEVKPAASENGMTYDPTVLTVSLAIRVTDEGQLEAVPSYEPGTTFTNIYEAECEWLPRGRKILLAGNRALKADEFTFELSRYNVDTYAFEVVGVYGHDAAGTINVAPVRFNETDAGKLYIYRLREIAGSETGMHYADNVVFAMVRVAFGEPGEMDVAVTYYRVIEDDEGHSWNETVDEVVFMNRYEATGSVTQEVLKVFDSWQALVADQFSFEMMDAAGQVIGTYGHDADGNIRFEPLTYTEADIGKTFTYTVREIPGPNPHIHYDPNEFLFDVSVTDAGGGELAISIAYPEAGMVFYNDEDDPLPLIIDPQVEKRVDGAGAPVDTPFVFELRALTAGAPMPAGSVGDVLQHTLAGPGSFFFGEIAFPQVAGVYQYEVVEVRGDTAGFTYDETVFTIEVAVAWDEDAYAFVLMRDMEAAEGPVEDMVFLNRYKAPPPDIPKTGEAKDSLPWLGFLCLSSATFMLRRRRKKEAGKVHWL